MRLPRWVAKYTQGGKIAIFDKYSVSRRISKTVQNMIYTISMKYK